MEKFFRLTPILVLTCLLLPAGASAWYDYGYYDYSYYYPQYYQTYYYEPTYYYPQQYYFPQVNVTTQVYVGQQSYYPSSAQSYGGYSTPSPSNYNYPVGDTDTFGSDICYWEGYGRGLCSFNPRQPVYDHWTGTWY